MSTFLSVISVLKWINRIPLRVMRHPLVFLIILTIWINAFIYLQHLVWKQSVYFAEYFNEIVWIRTYIKTLLPTLFCFYYCKTKCNKCIFSIWNKNKWPPLTTCQRDINIRFSVVFQWYCVIKDMFLSHLAGASEKTCFCHGYHTRDMLSLMHITQSKI